LIVEIRTYRLKPGTGQEFERVMREEASPLLAEAGLRVLDFGRSLLAEDGQDVAYLIRAFETLEERERQEDEFYGSDRWWSGPREAIVSRIESMHTVVLESSIPDAFTRARPR